MLQLFIMQQPHSGNCLFACNCSSGSSYSHNKSNNNLQGKPSIKRAKGGKAKGEDGNGDRDAGEGGGRGEASAQVAESSNDGHLS